MATITTADGFTAARRPTAWPWALLVAGLAALLLPAVLCSTVVPSSWYEALTVASAIGGFTVSMWLARRPLLRIVVLSVGVLAASSWAAWCYLSYARLWPADLAEEGPLPWYVANLDGWAVVLQPFAIVACAAAAAVALVRLKREDLRRTGRWTALLCLALLICLVAGLQVLQSRAWAA